MNSKLPLVSIKNVSAGYNGNPVLTDVNLDIYPYDFIGVIGPNGGGKTTLSKVLLGILKPIRGQVLFPSGRLNIGYLPQVSQIDHAFPITIREVVLSGSLSGQSWWKPVSGKLREKADRLIAQMGLDGLEDRPIGELSGGQLQRALLARAIINDPQLLVLDEPDTFVDRNFEGELYQLLEKLNESMAIFLISHDIGTISSIVKTIACVNGILHYHPSNVLTAEMLQVYNCPIDLITHGQIPHRVLKKH
ncbi:MAG: zinc transporter ATP-binding protein [Anaerophaga sp.]|uniref:metal ABC transporter ATP-binding protein n=1 Tax=Anaerophaga thermohalophila TaxID=177400 RepID=UPI000237C274|nr:metal ABC transporter ATP-binding protein [Anaerophaga thermohalophila]MBZ4675605.1 zinc transporter ATP-binding protein [Anaerophaga sp.]MDI3520104.1 zinc transport system ATP-binding protein [Anaerophaga sp.]